MNQVMMQQKKSLEYMNENEVEPEEAAKWWITENEDIWTTWVSEEVAKKVKATLIITVI